MKVKSVPLSSERENLNIDSHDSGNGCFKPSPSKMHTPWDKNCPFGSRNPPPAHSFISKLKVGLLNVGGINSRLGFNTVSLGQRRCNALLLGCLQTWGSRFQLTRETKLPEQNLLPENQPTLPPRKFQFYQQQTSKVQPHRIHDSLPMASTFSTT